MNRLKSIDATRGLVMLLMLLDHIREFFYLHAQVSDPVNVSTTPADLFFIRLSAHFCAPIFIGLTGLAAWLYQNKNSKPATSEFLLKRGFFLILLELTVINFGWTFSFTPSVVFLQVIWAIGLSMLALSALIWLPTKVLAGLAGLIMVGHNLLDPIHFQSHEWGHNIWAILHDRTYIELFSGLRARTSYPVLPWIGVISLGYLIGPWFSSSMESSTRQKYLSYSGYLLIGAFFILRSTNIYGENLPWELSENLSHTLISFFNVTKYPPSLDFLLLTLGFGALILNLLEKKRAVTDYLVIFGSTPLFFYIVHIYILNVINRCFKYFLGANEGQYFSFPNVASLIVMTMVMTVPMYSLCKWYNGIKRGSTNPLFKYF